MLKDNRFTLVTFLFLFIIVGSVIPVVYSQTNDDDQHLPGTFDTWLSE